MEKIDQAILEMRRDKVLADALVCYINVRIAQTLDKLAISKLNERDADEYRGAVKELKKLRAAVQTGGEEI